MTPDEKNAKGRICRALYQTPLMGAYGPDASADTWDDVIECLEQLGPRIKQSIVESEATRAELAQLRRDVAAFRRVMGLER